MAYKQKSGSPFQRNFGIGKSPLEGQSKSSTPAGKAHDKKHSEGHWEKEENKGTHPKHEKGNKRARVDKFMKEKEIGNIPQDEAPLEMKSPMKVLGNWITGDDGIPVQVSKQDYIAHQKKTGKLIKERRDAKVYDDEGRLIEGEAAKKSMEHEFIGGDAELGDRASTTGQESIDALKTEYYKLLQQGGKLTSGQYKGVKVRSFDDYMALGGKENQKLLAQAQAEAKSEKKSGVAAAQRGLDQTAREVITD